MSTLIIPGVDFDLLEKQRLGLIDLETTMPDSYGLECMRGVIELLDHWSDDEYYKKYKVAESDREFVKKIARTYDIALTDEEADIYYKKIQQNANYNDEAFYYAAKEFFNN